MEEGIELREQSYEASAEGEPQSFSTPASSCHRALEKTPELEAPDSSLRVQVR